MSAPAPAAVTAYSAITLWQPWASLVAEGVKPFEFRSWPAPKAIQGRRVAIHAGARPARRQEMLELLYRLELGQYAATGLLPGAHTVLVAMLRDMSSIPRSAVICLATLGEPVRNGDLERRLGLPVTHDSDRSEHSNWGWPLVDIERLQPCVPAAGRQGWWTWKRRE